MPVDPRRVQSLFLEAVEHAAPADRAAVLDRGCGSDAELRRRVEALLRAHDEPDSRLDRPVVAPPGPPESEPGEAVGSVGWPGQVTATTDPTGPAVEAGHDPTRTHGPAWRPPAERPGARIGPYKLLQPIGQGGMGTVYMAEQEVPVRRKVALKVIKAGMDSAQVVARFEAERQALALMDHPNIARVLDAGATDAGRPYFVMELVKGIAITRYCDEARLSTRDRLALFIPVCQAIQHAHQKGIIHRDVKPSNVLVTLIDGRPVPKVIDFGVAKATDQRLTERTLFTQFGALVGTPEYMSPEQAEISGLDVDTRSDVYSLGVLLYELLTGTTPLDREALRRAAFAEVLRRIKEEEPLKPSTRLSASGDRLSSIAAVRGTEPARLARALRGDLDWVVMKSLEKDRARRYETANGLARDVRRYLDGDPVEAGPPSASYRLRKSARKHRAGLAVAAAFALLLVVAAGVSTWEAFRATRAEATARAEAGRATRAEATARAEAEQATAISKFLTDDLLLQATPANHPVSERVTLRDVLDRAADRVGERFRTRPLVEAALRSTIGETYGALGAWEQGREQLAAAQALYERELGPDDPKAARLLARLGRACRHLHHYREAEEHFRRAAERLRRVLGAEYPYTLDDLNALAELAVATPQVKMEEAEARAEEVLAVARRAMGAEARRTLDYMTNLAQLYLFRGKLAQAEPLAAEALEGLLRTAGEQNPGTLWAMELVGWIREARGKPAEAEPLLARVVEIRCRVLGEAHYETVNGMANLAGVYLEQGKLSEAGQVLRRAYRVLTEHPSDRAPRWGKIAMHLVTLAGELERAGRADEAGAAYREALAMTEAMLARAPDQPATQNSLAWYLATGPLPQLRDPARAVELARKAVQKMPRVASYWNTLGVSLYRAGDCEGAIEALEKAEALEPDKYLGDNGLFLATAHWRLGREGEALTWYGKAVAWMGRDRPKDPNLARFHAEAAALLGLAELPTDVFARP
jgi:serine/threonine protein kinase/tetratricopeptide (TPR) repeat protein